VGLKNKEVSVPFEVEALKLHVKKKNSTKFILTVYSILSFSKVEKFNARGQLRTFQQGQNAPSPRIYKSR